MGVNVSLDVFQEKMANLLEGLEFVRTYLDDLLVIYNAMFEEHLSQLTTVLRRLRRAGLKVNAEKSFSLHQKLSTCGTCLQGRCKTSTKEDPSSSGSTSPYYSQAIEKPIGHGIVLKRHVEA